MKTKKTSRRKNSNAFVKIYNHYFYTDEEFLDHHDWGKIKYLATKGETKAPLT